MSARRTRLIKSDNIDIEEATKFLRLLKPKASSWTFQTYGDNTERNDQKLVTVRHGTLGAFADEFERLNKKGAGIFATMNRTDGEARKTENIKSVRAVSVDLDGAPIEPVQNFELPPHIVVETSPGRWHAYWRVKGLALDEFEGVQRAIAKQFDGDPSVAKLTHCARLPGFFHCKDKPFKTRIIETNEVPSYSADEIRDAFPPIETAHKLPTSHHGRLVLSSKMPKDCARAFAKSEYTIDGQLGLVYWRGDFYRWTGSHYTIEHDKTLRSKLYGFLEGAVTAESFDAFNPTPGIVNQVIDVLQSGVNQEWQVDAPFFIDKDFGKTTDSLLAFENGVLNLKTNKLKLATPTFFNIQCLPFDFDPNAPRPKLWMHTLHEYWPHDKNARRCLQEIFGLMLTHDTSFQKIFMLVGPKRSGKGTIGRILTYLLGRENVANPTLSSFSGEFGLSPLINKKLAMISDARMGQRSDSSVVAERLLSISGEDSLNINRKYKDHWVGRLNVRFLVMTNELPKISDASGALSSRFIILTMQNSFLGSENRHLERDLKRELPGILNWSLEGLARVLERGHFEQPASSEAAIKTLEDLASPIAAFLRDFCIVEPNKRINVKVAYAAWKVYCNLNGLGVGSNAEFGRNLKATLPSLSPRGRMENRFYQGFDLNRYGRRKYENNIES